MTRRTLDRLVLALLVGILLLAALPVRVRAQQSVSHQTLTVSAGNIAQLAAATTAPGGSPVTFCVVSVEGAGVRYWFDGSGPTTTSGHLTNAGGNFVLPSVLTASGFAVTTVGVASAVQVSCFRGGTPVAFLTAYDPSQAALTIAGTVPTTTAPTLPLTACNALVRTNCK